MKQFDIIRTRTEEKVRKNSHIDGNEESHELRKDC